MQADISQSASRGVANLALALTDSCHFMNICPWQVGCILSQKWCPSLYRLKVIPERDVVTSCDLFLPCNIVLYNAKYAFVICGKNLAYSTKYLRNYCTDLHQIFWIARIGRHMGRDDKSFFTVAQGTLLWYPVTLWAKIEHKLMPPSVFALAFPNSLEYRCLNALINSRDDPALLCKHLVNLGFVTTAMTWLICVPLYLYWAKISLFVIIRYAGILKRVG